jgi:hypothetical protein
LFFLLRKKKMHTVSLQFQLEWTLEHISPAEHEPEIRVFFDSRLIRDPIVVKHSPKPQLYTISGKISKNYKTIPGNTHVGLAGFAWRNNSNDAPCLLDIGTNHIQLSDISDEILRAGVFRHKMPLVMRTTTEVDPKEYITITVQKGNLKMGDLEFSQEQISAELIGETINAYIEGSMTTETNMTDTIAGTARIRVPAYIGESGLELTNGVALPAVAFALSETPKVNDLFWYNAFENTMRRDQLIPADWDRLNIEGQCRTTIQMITQLTQAFDYVSDTVDKNTADKPYDASQVVGIEQFSNQLVTGSGDCEDGGASEKDCHTAFITHKFGGDPNVPSRSVGAGMYRYICEAQQLARQYIPCFSLDAVRGAAVADDTTHIGAHMNINFIPIAQFQTWLSATPAGRQLAKTLPWDKSVVPRRDIPFAIGEGTGPYDAIGFNDPYASAIDYVHQIRDLYKLRTPIEHERGKTTSFFIGSLTGLTDYFIMRGTNIGSFLYGTKQAGGKITRGAYYDDMINNPEKIAIVLHDKIPNDVMNCIKDSVSIRVPPEPLVLTSAQIDAQKRTNEHLEHIKNSVQKLGRNKAPSAGPGPEGPRTAYVNVYVRDYQINQLMANRIVDDIRKLPSILSVDYYPEQYTDKFYGYTMRIQCEFKEKQQEINL